MAEYSDISWTDGTFSPWFGCTKVSVACDNCYAENWSVRYGKAEWGAKAERKRSAPSTWAQPLAWNRKAAAAGTRKVVFVAELADVFDNKAPDGWRADLWQLMRDTPHLLWLVLTKRPQNAAKMLPADWPLPNVWLGCTVENQVEADRRLPVLASLPAAGRFVSCEPLLGPVYLMSWLDRIDYLIAGCESRGARVGRPTDTAWVRSLRDQCDTAGTAFHLKQLDDGNGKIAHLPMLDGKTHTVMPDGRPSKDERRRAA